jgi:hypothetical protein
MWVQDLGLVDEGDQPTAWTEPVDPEYLTAMSAYGSIRMLTPALRLDASPGHYARTPEPPGASLAEWLPLASS